MTSEFWTCSATQSWWIQELDLREGDSVTVVNGEYLSDCHMHAVHNLPRKQFPGLDGSVNFEEPEW